MLLEKGDDRGAGLGYGAGSAPLRPEIDEKDLQPLPQPLRGERREARRRPLAEGTGDDDDGELGSHDQKPRRSNAAPPAQTRRTASAAK